MEKINNKEIYNSDNEKPFKAIVTGLNNFSMPFIDTKIVRDISTSKNSILL